MAEKKTHEQFLIELAKINDRVKVLEKYVNYKTKILCECLDCSNQWMVTPEKLLLHRKCPECAKINRGLKTRTTQDEFISKMAKLHPNIEVLTPYVLSHKKVLCKCKIDNYEWEATPSSLLGGSGCPKCGKTLQITHEEFQNRVYSINKDIEILGRYTVNSDKIKCRCLKDGYVWFPIASGLMGGRGCPVCSNKKLVVGINDIATTHPDIVKYFANKEDAKKYTYGTKEKLEMKCDVCGNIQIQSINKLISRGFSCQRCSDGISYPNKFIYSVLEQLNIDFEKEKKFDWSENKRYDIYISSINTIIENMGSQHYRYTGFPIKLKENQENDKRKKEMALNNGIDKYIVLDCRESTKNFIENSVRNSELAKIFNLDLVNFYKCNDLASSNISKTILELWNSGLHNTTEIKQIVGISLGNVISKLNFFADLGMCDYGGKFEATKHMRKPVVSIETNQKFNSITECAKVFKITNSVRYAMRQIRKVCDGEIKSYGGYHFKYIQ